MRPGASGYSSRVEAAPVVLHHDAALFALEREHDPDAASLGMFAGIGERLLNYSEKLDFHGRIELVRRTLYCEVCRKAGELGESLNEDLEAFQQGAFLSAGSQAQDRLPHVVIGLLRGGLQLLQVLDSGVSLA
jgi:hypothetical protein